MKRNMKAEKKEYSEKICKVSPFAQGTAIYRNVEKDLMKLNHMSLMLIATNIKKK